jgi:hypothetical protein
MIHDKDTGCAVSCKFAIRHVKTANHIQRPGFNGISKSMGLPGKIITGECKEKVISL